MSDHEFGGEFHSFSHCLFYRLYLLVLSVTRTLSRNNIDDVSLSRLALHSVTDNTVSIQPRLHHVYPPNIYLFPFILCIFIYSLAVHSRLLSTLLYYHLTPTFSSLCVFQPRTDIGPGLTAITRVRLLHSFKKP